jgi:hypothetical protein
VTVDTIDFRYGHCQNGPRWFWCVEQPDGASSYGWEDTERGAISAARSFMVRTTNGAHYSAEHRKGLAERKLKSLPEKNQATKRPRQPRYSKKPRPTKADYELWKRLQPVPRPAAPVEDLAALRAAMLNAHPDRGGSNETFIEARQRYEAARDKAGRK